jgi:hypothetical protein
MGWLNSIGKGLSSATKTVGGGLSSAAKTTGGGLSSAASWTGGAASTVGKSSAVSSITKEGESLFGSASSMLTSGTDGLITDPIFLIVGGVVLYFLVSGGTKTAQQNPELVAMALA